MKKRYIIITTVLLITFLLFMGCSSNRIHTNINQNAEEYVANEDFQNYLDSYSSFVKTDNGYYFMNGLTLNFYDTEKNEAYPVCNKTNCEHSGSDCPAYFSPLQYIPMTGMHYYDNALYVLGFEKEGEIRRKNYLYWISLETLKHKKATYMFDSSEQLSIMYAMHRGYVYFVHGESPMKESTVTLYRAKLGDTSDTAPEAIYTFSGIGATIFGLSAYGNNLFFMAADYEDEKGNGYKTTLHYMDIHTLETNQIPEREFSHIADEGKVYYGKDEKTVECYDLKTKETTFFCNINGPCYISADSKYIYFDNKQKMFID
ncbi:MAG: hypothetical protein K2J59_08935, partial [Eubacterium sp.]|nr:hypothetical protein [Eubacterium sp.]